MLKLTGCVLGALVVFGSVALLALGMFQIDHFDRIYPGVSVWGVDLGGLRRPEAAERLSRQLAFLQEDAITFRDGGQVWSATPGQIGMSVRIRDAIDLAFGVGHSGRLLPDLSEQWSAYYGGMGIAPEIVIDMVMAEELVKGIAAIVNVTPRDASLSVIGSVLTVAEGHKGRTVNVSATVDELVRPLTGFSEADIPLVIDEFTPLLVDVEEQRVNGQRMLDAPLVLMVEYPREGDGPPWVVDEQALADMLTFLPIDERSDPIEYKVGLDQQLLVEFLQYAGDQLAVAPESARFEFDETTGELGPVRPAVVGRALDVEATLEMVNAALEAGEHNVYLRFRAVEPEIGDETRAKELGITGLVAQASTFFRGSDQTRRQNIRAGAETMHGIMVPPGEEFSFNANLGDISLDTGFAEAWIIFGGRTIQGVGGGICQVSTTAFRSAFFGGYPIVERNPHAYRVGYYEQGPGSPGPGLDATIFSPTADFRFKNDREAWLLIETEIDDEESLLTFRFYSVDDGRSVTVAEAEISEVKEVKKTVYEENPELKPGEIKQVDWENEGANVAVTRVVERGGEVDVEDVVRTTYQPWGSVYQFGPGTELPEGAEVVWATKDEEA
ncbi:MAG TPA: VanW family protein [Anaerolineales bacterium]|jgi:vancomycin resistance protein YoaR|nr:VanW family protein [Anaerolineales bacterium]